MTNSLNIIIVEKQGTLKLLSIKDYKEEELFKKCGFKKSDNFIKHTEWNLKFENNKYIIKVFGKIDGRPNSENKYDFPPPIDNTLFFGNCAIVASIKNNNVIKNTDISLSMWNKMYEKLFGGFEDLSAAIIEDYEEEDELENIPQKYKTKEGYLKDGFVLDGSDDDSDEEDEDYYSEDNEEDANEELFYKNKNAKKLIKKQIKKTDKEDEEIIIEDIGSELSEDSYDYN
jgi:hypothetical protein